MFVVALPSWCQSFPVSAASVARKQPLTVCQLSCQCFPCQCFSLQYNRNRHALLTGVIRAQLILANSISCLTEASVFGLTVTVHLQSTQLIQAATGRTVHANTEAPQDELKNAVWVICVA